MMVNFRWNFAVLSMLLPQKLIIIHGLRATATIKPSLTSITAADDSFISVKPNDVKRGVRNNKRVHCIMEILKDRYLRSESESSNGDWIKMRAFLYRATTSPTRGLTLYKTRKVLEYLDEFIPDRDFQRSIVMQSPRILTKNVKTRLRPTVEFLQSLYDENLFRTALSRNPDLLLTSGTGYEGDDLDLVETFLRTDLEFTQNSIIKLKVSNPQFFQLSMVQLLSVVNFLRTILQKQSNGKSNVDVQHKSSKIIAGLILSHPIIFQLSVHENLVPRIQFLQERCQLHDNDLAALLKSSSGAILGLSVKDNLEPTIDLLSNMLSDTELRKLLLSHAQILGLSLDNVKIKIAYFDAIDRMSQSKERGKLSLASRILMKAPATYSLSLTGNIVPTVNFLAKVWGQPCPDDTNESIDVHQCCKLQTENPTSQLASLLSECPSILTVSLVGNIIPTINFYVSAGYLSLDSERRLQALPDGRLCIIRGRYITASLFNRLLPRWYYHAERQMEERIIAPPLYVLAGATDTVFCDRFGYDTNDYIAFKDDSSPRLKFSSQFETWIQTGRPIDT